MLHSFFDRTLYIHHVERFGLCKKRSMRRKKRIYKCPCPKKHEKKKKKKEK